MGRRKREWTLCPEVAKRLNQLYSRLADVCNKDRYIYYDGLSYEDIFQETMLNVMCDIHAKQLNDDELIKYFCRRFKVFQYRFAMDARRLKTIDYADNKQISEKEDK
nr:MAG TPA: Sigma-70 region 2 [Caudoviricetes sp.]